MKIAIDTNRYVAFARGESSVEEILERAIEINVPLIVLGELRAGFLGGTRRAENEKYLVRFLNSPRVRILNPDEDTSHHYAQLYLQLKRQGTPMPTNDLWIAALAFQHQLILFARDKHFDFLPQIPRI